MADRVTSSELLRQPIVVDGWHFQLRQLNAGNGIEPDTLLIMFGFYNPSPEAINRYCSLYHDIGFNVLFVPSQLNQFAWPRNSLKLTNALLKYLVPSCAHYKHILVHAFSMGAYNFTVFFATMCSEMAEFGDIRRKLRGVVYDSLTVGTLQHMIRGISAGISKNRITRTLIPGIMNLYFYMTHSATVDFFDRYITIFKEHPLEVPTLVFYCKNDPLSDWKSITNMAHKWRSMASFQVTLKCWDKSKHAAHLRVHTVEYVKTLTSFLKGIPAVNSSIKEKSKL